MDKKVVNALAKEMELGRSVALVTITNKGGSGPRGCGSTMLVDKEGHLLAGTIGGGAIEEKAKQDAKSCLRRGRSESFHYELTMEKKKGAIGMACGGNVDIFVHVFSDAKSLVIFGGGHIGLSLSQMAKNVGYSVTVVDHREDYATADRFSWADKVIQGKPKDVIEQIQITEQTAVVIVTHGHVFDSDALREVIHSPATYIGMIGSVSKIKHCFSKLEEEGLSSQDLKRVYAPIGLDIGGEAPDEISLAILAEIQAHKYGKEAPFLKDKNKERIWP